MEIQYVFEALADANRRKILGLLKTQELSVGEIHAHLSISGASLSHHLSKLKLADLVASRRRGQTIIYRVNEEAFADIGEALAIFFARRE